MPHSIGKHNVVEHEDQGVIRPKSGTRVLGLTPNRDRFVPLSDKGSVDDAPNKYVAQPRADYPMEYVCNIKCGGGERERTRRTTFLDVPPNHFGCRGDDNERINESERTSMPPPETLCATGKGGGRSGVLHSVRGNIANSHTFRASTRRRRREERSDNALAGASAVWDGSCCLGRVLAGLRSRSKLVVGGAAHLRFVKAKANFKSSGRYP